MKNWILSILLLSAWNAHASESIVTEVKKSIKCQGATLVMELAVLMDQFPGSVPTVEWTVVDTESKYKEVFMGYLRDEAKNGALKEFGSTDLDSHVEVSGSLAVLQVGDKEEALFCKDFPEYVLPY